DQQAAVHAVATSSASLTAIIGPAGTGKSTTMKGLRTTWEGQFGEGTVIGLAPSAAAASVLGAEIGTKTDNLAKWVYESVGDGAKRRAETFTAAHERLGILQARLLLKPGNLRLAVSLRRTSETIARITALQDRYTMKAGQLVIIDEASMASTAALSLVGKQARDAGAKILLVGDPSQLGAIESGGMLGWMERTGQATALTNVFRFENEWEKDASLKLRHGDTRSITAYANHGRLIDGTEEELLIRVRDAWRQDTVVHGYTSLMIAPDNATVDQLNTMAQAMLRAEGKVSDEAVATLRREATAGVGDVVLARLNDRGTMDTKGEFVHNGTLITVDTIQRDGSITGTRADNEATITLPSRYLRESVELGYATTVNRSQGLTVDTAHALLTGETSREAAYVAMTRGRKANMVYIIDEEHEDAPDPDGMMRAQETHGASDILAAILKNSNPEMLAHEQIIASQVASMDFERLTGEYELVSKATATDATLIWLHTFAGESQVQAWRESSEFTALVAAWDPAVEALSVDEDTTAFDVVAALREHAALASAEPRLIGGLSVASPAQNELTEQLETMLESSLDTLVAKAVEDHAGAQWITSANVRQIVAWRAIAGRQFEKTALGEEPKSNDWRMWKYFDHIISDARGVDDKGTLRDENKANVVAPWEIDNFVSLAKDGPGASPHLGL
ncbi:MAG: AAA family ATPase, partial [Actinomycetales bacterium]|nr:AAA family ATPase [Actinomycetales bacterium]